MATRLSVRIDDDLEAQLQRAEKAGKKASDVVREALTAYFESGHPTAGSERSAYDAFRELGVIGHSSGQPPDLSTNRKYFEGFGTNAGRER